MQLLGLSLPGCSDPATLLEELSGDQHYILDLQYSDEQLDALFEYWFEFMIGEETLDEELDDLCLLLDYQVQSWGAKIS